MILQVSGAGRWTVWVFMYVDFRIECHIQGHVLWMWREVCVVACMSAYSNVCSDVREVMCVWVFVAVCVCMCVYICVISPKTPKPQNPKTPFQISGLNEHYSLFSKVILMDAMNMIDSIFIYFNKLSLYYINTCLVYSSTLSSYTAKSSW